MAFAHPELLLLLYQQPTTLGLVSSASPACTSPSVQGPAPLTYRFHGIHMIHVVSLPQVEGKLEAAHGEREEGSKLKFAIELAQISKP